MHYYKSKIIPFDQDSTVCWYVDNTGKERDIKCEDIPKGSVIVDFDKLLAKKEDLYV